MGGSRRSNNRRRLDVYRVAKRWRFLPLLLLHSAFVTTAVPESRLFENGEIHSWASTSMPIPKVSVFLNPASWYGSRAFWYCTRAPLFQHRIGICIAIFFPVLTGFFYYCNLFFPASRKKVYHIRRPLTLLVLRRKMK
jgi:hypothetical protein